MNVKSLMMDNKYMEAENEIGQSLSMINIFLRFLGVTFDDSNTSNVERFKLKLLFCLAILIVYIHTISDVIYMYVLIRDNPKLENFVHYFHMFGYGYLCLTRLYILWRKRPVFGRLLKELAMIWPTEPLPPTASLVKKNMLSTLRSRHIWYSFMTLATLIAFAVTPLISYAIQVTGGQEAEVGFIWAMWYPFDKHHPVAHVFVYLFEIWVGFVCALVNVTSDMWFTAMSNHISLLLRMLHMRLRALGADQRDHEYWYNEIIYDIKLHKTLIRYCNNMEDAFSTVNFNNVLLTSVNTCCAIFAVLLIDPPFAFGNKMFLVAYLVQTFVTCWYCDDIYYANAEVATAAYESNWYNLDVRCRRLLLLVIYRSQKSLGFTALKFTTITLRTFYTILSRSYSYFALLHTMYKRNA